MLSRLRAVAAGTGIPTISEAIGRADQTGKQRLIEAATVLQGSTQAARQYISILG